MSPLDKKITLGVVCLVVVFIVLSFGFFPSMTVHEAETSLLSGKVAADTSKADLENISVPPPPFSEDIFPCSDCHADQETNLQRRQLDYPHDEIVFEHDAEHRWCLDCHTANNRDMLHLANGTLVDFKESYILCGQCHGDKLRDWKVGVHGKRTGSWNGKKTYLLCAHCHNPHSPRFKPLKPLPPPIKIVKPDFLTFK